MAAAWPASSPIPNGYNWRALANALDFIAVPPDPPAVEKLRSYQHDGMFTGINADPLLIKDNPRATQWLPWYAVLHGFPALWITTPHGGAHDAAPHAALLPDGTPSDGLTQLLLSADELKGGLGALLLASTRVPAEIAILDSPASRYLNYISPPPGHAGDGDPETRFIEALETLGYQCDYLPANTLNTDTLAPYKVLVLPAARAISGEDVRAIRDFSSRGGVILADIPPATHDGHGALREEPPLEDLPRIPKPDEIETLLQDSGVGQTISLDRPFNGERIRLRFGTAEILACLASPTAEKQNIALKFGKDTNVYDLRLGQRMGFPRRARRAIPPGDVLLMSSLPYKVKSILVTPLPTSLAEAGRKIGIAVQSSNDSALSIHLFEIQQLDKYGNIIPGAIHTQIAPRGTAQATLPPSSKGALRTHAVQVRDVLTGATTRKNI